MNFEELELQCRSCTACALHESRTNCVFGTGNKNARLTLYSPEELETYGLATDPDMPLPAKFGANHASWILTLNNEHGILSWLTEQVKE